MKCVCDVYNIIFNLLIYLSIVADVETPHFIISQRQVQ